MTKRAVVPALVAVWLGYFMVILDATIVNVALLRAVYEDKPARARAVGIWGAIAGIGAASGPCSADCSWPRSVASRVLRQRSDWTRGDRSTRPELYKPSSSVEVKNYDVTSAAGRRTCPAERCSARGRRARAGRRARDARRLASRIAARSGGAIHIDDIVFIR